MPEKYTLKNTNNGTPLSEYAEFHFKFLGFFIKNTTTGKIYRKWELYMIDPALCKYFTICGQLIGNYRLVDAHGWCSGFKLPEEKDKETDEIISC